MKPFIVPHQGTSLRGDSSFAPNGPSILFLHGAGNASRERFSVLRTQLHDRGIGSAAFDHIGHGETGGELLGSSLEDRTIQASVVLSGLETQPRALFGTSMGAYTALKVGALKVGAGFKPAPTKDTSVQTLILAVPGVYLPEAYSVPFGPEFSALIRQERSWESSDAFEILSRFTGRLLVIRATHDEVVPAEIPEKLFESASQASHREMLDIDCGHQIMRHINSDPGILDDFAGKLASFLST